MSECNIYKIYSNILYIKYVALQFNCDFSLFKIHILSRHIFKTIISALHIFFINSVFLIVMVNLFDLIFVLPTKSKHPLLMVLISNLSDKSQSAHLLKEIESSALRR